METEKQENAELVIDWEAVNKMEPEDIENLRCECLKEVQEKRRMKAIVKDRIIVLSKCEIKLKDKISDLRSKVSKCQTNIDLLNGDIEILKSKFWEKKGRK